MKFELKFNDILKMRLAKPMAAFTPFFAMLASFFIINNSCFILDLRATSLSTVESGPWSSPAIWSSGAVPGDGDTAIITAGDSIWLDLSTAPLASITINGSLGLDSDTLFIKSSANPYDTLIVVQGILDAGTGWFVITGNNRPVVQLAAGSLFRTAATFPYPASPIFDSAISPIFACDSGSTFEYYSNDLGLTDISYLANNLFGHTYWNLRVTLTNATFLANHFEIRGALVIGLGATINPSAGHVGAQQITILGDVINKNEGDDDGPGAGLHGSGMLSYGNDTWIFGDTAKISGKDTCHWSGPSQLGTVIVRQSTVLSVRFIDDTHCDSLDILSELIEEQKPCGGHLIGRVFSEISQILDSTNPVDSFYGFGLTIKSGTNPYLGPTRVVRTSGYVPPGTENILQGEPGLGIVNPVLRYYSITPSGGPQLGKPDEMSFQVHCDELNGADPSKLHFWRSRNQGEAWAFSGITSYDAGSDVFVWDTTTLGAPNDSGSFYWILSDGYTDIPTPAELGSFNVNQSGNDIQLSWQTNSAVGIAGYEIARVLTTPVGGTDSETIASFETDDSLRCNSDFGASYTYTDSIFYSGPVRYDLYEVTEDGIAQWLASGTALVNGSNSVNSSNSPVEISYANGMLALSSNSPLDLTLTISDDIGRTRYSSNVSASNGSFSAPLALPAGFYFATCRWNGGETTEKILVVGQ